MPLDRRDVLMLAGAAPLLPLGEAVATFSTDAALAPAEGSASRFVLPKEDPFVAWPHQAAILKRANRPEAARLYLSWLLDKETQKNVWYISSVHTGVAPPEGYRPIWDDANGDPPAFGRFPADRGAVERFRAEIGLYVGEVKGDPSPGRPGLHPDKALPH